jgi:hypothetical protein
VIPAKAVSLTLSNDFWYYTAYGSTQFVMGEVTNNGSTIPSFVKISMDFLDGSDRVLASDWTYVTGSCRTLNASDIETDTCLVGGETGFFGEYVDVNMAQVAKVRYSFDYETYATSTPDARVIVSNGPLASADYAGDTKLRGTLKNTGSASAKFAMVHILLRGSGDQLLDEEFTYVDGSTIDGTDTGLHPGEIGEWDTYTDAPFTSYTGSTTKTGWDDYGTGGGGGGGGGGGDGEDCTYAVNPPSRSFQQQGGSSSVVIDTQDGCTWSARSNASWITLISAASGSGTGYVSYQVDPNDSGDVREGAIIFNGDVVFAVSQEAYACQTDYRTLCLNQHRFQVRVNWENSQGEAGNGRVVSHGTDDSGLFWFFKDSNWEMLVKILNGCGLNSSYWVFAAATTNVEYRLFVTDTQTGDTRTYFNEQGTYSPAIIDTHAFSGCP